MHSIRQRSPAATQRHIDRHGKTDADEEILLGGIDDARDDANHRAVASQQRAAGIAGIHRRVDLNEAVQFNRAADRAGRIDRNQK